MSEKEADQGDKSPFEQIGSEGIAQIALRFYAVMASEEPKLAQTHECDEQGRILPEMQEKFALFLVGWLGGPQLYVEKHGHPQLRRRHAHVRIDKAMRDAWLRCMAVALDEANLSRPLREFLDERFYGVANHLLNA